MRKFCDTAFYRYHCITPGGETRLTHKRKIGNCTA